MKLELKDYYSPDIDSVWQWQPENPEKVYFLLEINIGEFGSEASDIFQVVIATPQGLSSSGNSDNVLSNRATIIFREYSWTCVVRELNSIINACESKDWTESVCKLQRHFQWEYEGYLADDLH